MQLGTCYLPGRNSRPPAVENPRPLGREDVKNGRSAMNMQRDSLLFIILAAAAASPAAAQTVTPAGASEHGAVSIPDFSRVWNHPAFPWFEPPASGPGPITNLSRWAEQRPGGLAGSAA